MALYYGTGRRKALGRWRRKEAVRVLVTTYGTLGRDIGKLRQLEVELVVLDEAQAIKNVTSQTAKACRLIQARQRLALTGTPVENHLGELWSLFELLNPGMLGQLPSLAKMAGKQDLGEEALGLVAKALRPLILRRTKGQVLKDLPTKTEQTLYCELSSSERKRYQELLHHYRRDLAEKLDTVGLGRTKMDPGCPVFLISLEAGGVGLNLTAASYVFLLDPWWNPAVESQAIDRAHRIGQEKPVFAYRLIARDTVEEKILQMQESKRALANAIVAQDRRVLGQMTAKDLELLLGGSLGS